MTHSTMSLIASFIWDLFLVYIGFFLIRAYINRERK